MARRRKGRRNILNTLRWVIVMLQTQRAATGGARCAGGMCGSSEIFVIFLILGRVGVPYIFLGHKDIKTQIHYYPKLSYKLYTEY